MITESDSERSTELTTNGTVKDYSPPAQLEPLVGVPNTTSSRRSFEEGSKKPVGYRNAMQLLSTDPSFQKEITLGRRIGLYKIGKELGTGNFSKVKLGFHVLTKDKVAVKIMEKTKMDPRSQKQLDREVNNMECVHHPNIIRLFEVMETLSKMYFVLEYAPGGELYHKVIDNGKMQELEAKRLYAQVVAAVVHMHEKNIIHRDIKAENVFFAGPQWVKLGDFGFSRAVDPGQSLNTFCGSPPYAAPELFKDEHYQGEYVDIWALGILIYFMVTGNTPFRGDSIPQLKRQIMDGFFIIPDYVSPFAQDLVNGILKAYPLSRRTLPEIQNHHWMGKITFPQAYTRHELVPSSAKPVPDTLVAKVREIMHDYDISDQMMISAAQSGAKNAIIGIYRLLLCQYQQDEILEDREKLDLDSTQSRTPNVDKPINNIEKKLTTSPQKSFSRLCTIL